MDSYQSLLLVQLPNTLH